MKTVRDTSFAYPTTLPLKGAKSFRISLFGDSSLKLDPGLTDLPCVGTLVVGPLSKSVSLGVHVYGTPSYFGTTQVSN